MQRYVPPALLVLLATVAASLSGCGGPATTVHNPLQPATISLSLDATSIITRPGGPSVTVHTISTDTNTQATITLTVSTLPAGFTAAFTQPGTGTTGAVTFTESASAAGGVYPLVITASDGIDSATATLLATVSAVDAVTITPGAPPVVSQDGGSATTAFSVGRSVGNYGSITVTATGLPTGVSAVVTQPGSGNDGTIVFTPASTPAAAGTYPVTLTATDGTASATATLPVVVAVAEHIFNTADTTAGVNGQLRQAMSTGFQPSIYSDAYLPTYGSAATVRLANLNSQHVRVQPILGDVPQQTNSSPQRASDWSFVALDQTVQPLLALGDKSPELQLATAPPFLNDANGVFIVNSTNLALLASYAANVVRYYNTGGFNWGGQHFQSASGQHITWWAIFNEPNLNGLTPAQYVQIYNALVPAMLAVDPTIKFSALELSGYVGQAQRYLPTMVLPANAGGLAAQVNNMSIHFYAICNQSNPDSAIFTAVTGFTSAIAYMRAELNTRSDLSGLPVWVTESNVNADYQLLNGRSDCQPSQVFVSDPRGTSAFFAAWRPFVFSQLGKAGNQALYQFTFDGSNQYGEVNADTNVPFLSYWVDYWLQRYFPFDPATAGSSILRSTTSESTNTVEVLATRNLDNSVSLLVSDIALAKTTDNNGPGAPRTVLVDVSALGTFSSASMTVLDVSTPLLSGPTSTSFKPGSVLTVTLGGYGTSLIKLVP